MPFYDLWGRVGYRPDEILLYHSLDKEHRRPARCHAFEKDMIECSHGIGKTRANKECKQEIEDFRECVTLNKTLQRLKDIRKQRDKLIKEGKYTPPPHHSGKGGLLRP